MAPCNEEFVKVLSNSIQSFQSICGLEQGTNRVMDSMLSQAGE